MKDRTILLTPSDLIGYSQNCPPLAGNVDRIRNGNFDFIHSRNKSESVTELEHYLASTALQHLIKAVLPGG